jgi:MerR family transcriptional regulator, light-induced transcriptional regulator
MLYKVKQCLILWTMKFPSNYSIKDLEKLSGIKAHTLRIWEKRYGLFKPDRTDTNIRYYTNDDLVRILSISQLNKNGFKISLIAGMSDAEINSKISALSMNRAESEDLIDNLIVNMIDINETGFNKAFSVCLFKMGFEDTIQKVIFPFFHRIGVMWQTGGINPAQEHFVTNIIRQKLIAAIDGIAVNEDQNAKCAVLFLPNNELHEMSLLFYNYALRARNFKTIYLGQSVPEESLMRVVKIVKPDYLIGVLTNPFSEKELDKFFVLLSSLKTVPHIFLSGKALLDHKKKKPEGISVFEGLADLDRLLKA